MIRFLAVLGLVITLTAASAAERIPADCRWVVQIDVQAFAKGKGGAWLRDLAKDRLIAARLQMFEAISGLNPERDLRTVTLCGSDGQETSGLVLVRGALDAAKLTTISEALEGHAMIPVGARTIHTWVSDGKPAAACLAAPDLLILGRSADRVRTAVATLDGSYVPPVALPTGWEGSAFAIAAAEGVRDWVGKGPQSALFANVSGFAARLGEDGPDLSLDAVATALGETQAQQMVDAGNGLRAIVQIQKPANLDPALFEALRTAQLSRSGATVSLHARLPLIDALRIIDQKRKGG